MCQMRTCSNVGVVLGTTIVLTFLGIYHIFSTIKYHILDWIILIPSFQLMLLTLIEQHVKSSFSSI